MLKRVADSLYWLSRYVERAENMARLVDVSLQHLPNVQNLDNESLKKHWEPILLSTGDSDLFYKVYQEANSETLTHFLTFDENNPSSIQSCILAARQNAHMIRDQISEEMWEVINLLYHFLKNQDAKQVWEEGPFSFYKKVKEFSHLFQGLTSATFPRQEGYDFVEMGKFIERADKTGRILDMKYHLLLPEIQLIGTGLDHGQWGAVLLACSADAAYRKTYLSELKPKFIVDILVLSRTFPRSIHYCLMEFNNALHRRTGCPLGSYSNEAERICGKLLADLSFKTPDDIISVGLHEQLAEIEETISLISLLLSKQYMFFPVVDPAQEEQNPAKNQ